MTETFIIEVNSEDKEIGRIEKMQAHREGKLHRAFSVFVFSKEGELMLQKRADSKYHSAGLWTNTCCSHPEYGEKTEVAVQRRLLEEMGLKCDVQKKFEFTYRATLDHGLIEHEVDHVYFAKSSEVPVLNPEEASDWKFVNMAKLKNDMDEFPEKYTVWLQICFTRVYDEWIKYF